MAIDRETTREELSRPTPKYRMGHVLELDLSQPNPFGFIGGRMRAFVIRVDWVSAYPRTSGPAYNRWRYFLQFSDRTYGYADEGDLERVTLDNHPLVFPPITDDEEAMALESCRRFSPERFDEDGRPISLED